MDYGHTLSMTADILALLCLHLILPDAYISICSTLCNFLRSWLIFFTLGVLNHPHYTKLVECIFLLLSPCQYIFVVFHWFYFLFLEAFRSDKPVWCRKQLPYREDTDVLPLASLLFCIFSFYVLAFCDAWRSYMVVSNIYLFPGKTSVFKSYVFCLNAL